MEPFYVRTEEEFNVIYHSYRMKIITAFSQQENMTATFKQIGDLLGDASSKVTYHGKMMIKIGLLELHHTELINGITAKYFRLVSDDFRIQLDRKNDPILTKKVMKHQARLVLDSLDEMKDLVGNFDNKPRSLIMSSNDLYLTDDEINELNELIHRFSQKKKKQENTRKVSCYHLLVDHKENK